MSTKAAAINPRLTVPGPAAAKCLGPIGNSLKFAHDSIGYTRQLFEQ